MAVILPSSSPEPQTFPVSGSPFGSSAALSALPAVGLVPSATSDTFFPFLRIDRGLQRLRSMKKTVMTAARLHQNSDTRARPAMVTLTYRDDEEYCPRDVSDFLKRARQWAARRGFNLRGLFVLETTKRGRPHYHVMLWLPRGLSLPKPDKQGWWKKGMSRIEYVRRAVGYMAKYASKGESDGIPAGARLYGAFGLAAEGRAELSWWRLPVWLRERVTSITGLVRVVGVGWISTLTGEVFLSPWEVKFEGGQVWVRLKDLSHMVA